MTICFHVSRFRAERAEFEKVRQLADKVVRRVALSHKKLQKRPNPRQHAQALRPRRRNAAHGVRPYKRERERDQADHSSMTSYHEQVLASSKQKAQAYVESYQQGDQIFDLPLPEVIETQLQSYTAACQSLGGVLPNPQQNP